ncbi:MAG: hypothetical protein IJW59_05160 [Clostridia bacterium]|nr:hypothetical protein [Clostridia bacterium]
MENNDKELNLQRKIYDLDAGQLLYSRSSLDDDIKSGQELNISVVFKDALLFNEKIEKLIRKLQGSNIQIISIEFSSDQGYIYDEKQVEKLVEISKYCSEKNIYFGLDLNGETSGFENFSIARKEVEDFAQKVNSMTIEENGKQVHLSPFEKFVICYRFASSRVYKRAEDFWDNSMRNWMGLLSTDNAICSGFASLLKCLCDRVFDKDELQCFEQSSNIYNKKNEYLGSHENNLVFIKDPKYQLDGMYYSDACWGAQHEKNGFDSTFEYCLFPISRLVKDESCNYQFENGLFFYTMLGDGVTYVEDGIGKPQHNHPAIKALFEKFGLKTEEEIRQGIDIAKIVADERAKADKHNKSVTKTVGNYVDYFFEKNNISELATLPIACVYPRIAKQQLPYLEKVESIMTSAKMDSLNDDFVEFLKEYADFYKAHKQEIDVLDYALKLNIFNYAGSIKYAVKKAVEKNEKTYFSEMEKKEELYKKILALFKEQKEKLIQEHEGYLIPQEIPLQDFERVFEIVAQFEGKTNKSEQADFAQKKVGQMQKLVKDDFGMDLDNVSQSEMAE